MKDNNTTAHLRRQSPRSKGLTTPLRKMTLDEVLQESFEGRHSKFFEWLDTIRKQPGFRIDDLKDRFHSESQFHVHNLWDSLESKKLAVRFIDRTSLSPEWKVQFASYYVKTRAPSTKKGRKKRTEKNEVLPKKGMQGMHFEWNI